MHTAATFCDSGVTGGIAPGDTLQGGDTLPKINFCGWI